MSPLLKQYSTITSVSPPVGNGISVPQSNVLGPRLKSNSETAENIPPFRSIYSVCCRRDANVQNHGSESTITLWKKYCVAVGGKPQKVSKNKWGPGSKIRTVGRRKRKDVTKKIPVAKKPIVTEKFVWRSVFPR